MLPIITDRLELRELLPDDFVALHRFASDPEVTRYMTWGPNTEDDTRQFIERARRNAGLDERIDFELAVIYRPDGGLIGCCGLHGRRTQYHEYEIGFCLNRDYWSRGIGSELVRRLVDFAFSSLEAHRLYGLVDPENVASGRLFERLGFRLEGLQKKDTLVRGEWRDSRLYALLDDDARPSGSVLG